MESIILQFFEQIRCPACTQIFAFFSLLGEGGPVALCAILFYWLGGKTGELLAVVTVTSFPVNSLLKTAVSRPRPYAAGVVSRLDFDTPLCSTRDLGDFVSFPSGHAQSTSALLFAFSVRKRKKSITAVCMLCILLIALSRLYFGVHYPSDVLAGALLGMLLAALWAAVYEKAYEKRFYLLAALGAAALVGFALLPAHDNVMPTGLLAGVAAFLPLSALYAPPLPRSCRKYFRIVVGAAAAGAVFAHCLIIPDGDGFSLLRYFLAAGGATAGAQALFRLLKI